MTVWTGLYVFDRLKINANVNVASQQSKYWNGNIIIISSQYRYTGIAGEQVKNSRHTSISMCNQMATSEIRK